MMTWSLELEVLAWLCLNIQIEIPHNQLNGRQAEIPNPGFLMILFLWNSLILKWMTEVYSKNCNLCAISSVSQSPRVVTCSAIFQWKQPNLQFWTSTLDPEITPKHTQHHLYPLLLENSTPNIITNSEHHPHLFL